MRLYLYLFLFLTLWPGLALAASVTLEVVDPQGAPVAEAHVEITHRDGVFKAASRTEAGGEARFRSLAPGPYLLTAVAPGFARQLVTLRLAENESRSLTVRLEIAAVSESIVVTSAATAQGSSDVTKSVSVVESDEIVERDESLVTEALRTAPGLRVVQLGGPGGFTSIRTRGMRTEDTAVLVDGARLRDPAAPQGDASAFLQSLLVTDVSRLEILRGTGSTLHGTNAGGGVINVVTAPGGGETRGSALVEGGGLGFFRATAQTAGGFGDRLLYSVGLAHLNVASGIDGNDASRDTSVQGRALVALDPRTSVSFRFYGVDGRSDLNESPLTLGPLPDGIIDASANGNFLPAPDDPDAERTATFYSALASFEQRPRPELGYSFRYHGLFTDRSFADGPLGTTPFEPASGTLSTFEGDIHTLAARADFELGQAQLLSAGYELERESFLNVNVPELSEPASSTSVSQSSHSFYVQDQLTFLDGALALAGSARAQLFSLSTPELTPAASAPYRDVSSLSPESAVTFDVSGAYGFRATGTRVRAHYGTGYRAPSLYERFGTSFSSFGYSVFGDPRLSPEKTRTLDAGVEQRALAERVDLSATYFRTRLARITVFDFSGAIDPATDPFGRFGGYLSADGGVTQGVELTSAVALGNVRLRASYTYADAEPPAGVTPEQTRAFVIPRHQGSLVASASLGPRWALSFDLYASSDFLAPVFDLASFTSRVYRFEGFVKADVVASYRLRLGDTGLRLFGKIDNVFDESIFESGYPTPGRYGLVGVGLDF